MAYPFNGVGDFEHHHLAMTAMQALLLKLPDTILSLRTGRCPNEKRRPEEVPFS
jgi:hypothetical protein